MDNYKEDAKQGIMIALLSNLQGEIITQREHIGTIQKGVNLILNMDDEPEAKKSLPEVQDKAPNSHLQVLENLTYELSCNKVYLKRIQDHLVKISG